MVAEQVGRLADHSGKSVDDINALVEKASAEAARCVETSAAVKRSIDQIAVGVGESDRMAGAIAAAMEQQQSAVTRIKALVSDLNLIGQSNASAAEQITATMVELSRLASHTNQELQRFRF